jgi:excisionase family DNA binding protein
MQTIKTLGLKEAADFLKMHSEEVRKRAKAGRLPGAKLGKRWVFIESDLAEHLRTFYVQPLQALQINFGKENSKCHSLNEARRGGLISRHHQENELDVLLKLQIKPKLRSSMTS